MTRPGKLDFRGDVALDGGCLIAGVQAVLPASTVTSVPVMFRPPSPRGYSTMEATSSASGRRRKLLALAARDGDHIVSAGRGEPARNGKADPATAAGDDDVTHRCVPVSPLP